MTSAVVAGHEHQAFEQVHVLFVLEQCAVQGRYHELLVAAAQRLGGNVLGDEELEPVEQLGGGGLLLETGDLAQAEEDLERFLQQGLLISGKCTSTIRCMVSRSGKRM